MRFVQDYDRRAVVMYAHQWAYGRNPAFYDYENLGGDYYIDSDQKAPAWTGVPYLYNFLTRNGPSVGPVGEPCDLEQLRQGDLIQLSFKGTEFQHSPIVVSVGNPVTPENVLIAAHSYDADNRPLSTYEYRDIRFVHILGTMRP